MARPYIEMILLVNFLLLTMIFPLINGNILSRIEQPAFELRVKQAETILFGRFLWMIPINHNDLENIVHATKQDTFEFSVYCTIKKSKAPENVPRVIRILIPDTGRIHQKERVFSMRNPYVCV